MEITDKRIWQLFIELCEEQIQEHLQYIQKLKQGDPEEEHRLEVRKKMSSLPSKCEMDNLLRYETTFDRQLYKAINQLEREQRRRLGDHVPAPIQVDIEAHGTEGIKLV